MFTVCGQLPLAFAGMVNLHFGTDMLTPAVGSECCLPSNFS